MALVSRGTGASAGTRAGSRRGPRRKARFQPALLLLALAITGCVAAWGYLVWAAIDFGASARGGDSQAWWFLALAATGAVAALFVALMLVALLLRRLGITAGPPARTSTAEEETDGPRPIGGRHAG